jgi:RNA polymerase sigma-70 factor (ECF subfamily)
MAQPDSIPPPFDEPHTGARFRTTHWSLIVRAGQDDPIAARQALGELCRNYWYPLYAFVRRQGCPPADAEDLTQSFLAKLLEKNYLADVRREQGKFRSFLLVAIKRFMGHEHERQHAQKRGGFQAVVSIDQDAAESRLCLEADRHLEPDVYFERQWAIALLERVMLQLGEEYLATGRAKLFESLQGCLVKDESAQPYAELAAQLQLTEPAVKMAVSRLRARYREILRAEIAETVANPEEIEDEIRYLFKLFSS